jgi:hypothetical protein
VCGPGALEERAPTLLDLGRLLALPAVAHDLTEGHGGVAGEWAHGGEGELPLLPPQYGELLAGLAVGGLAGGTGVQAAEVVELGHFRPRGGR